ncbi:hypothetical protein B9Z19DRAFT_1191631 [Tuber borchii]|uniref:Uncharacterized protein n=1 Tax=Tuber borchii TaxID=42251 RepID=A0A2T6ZZ34_TUBBO|nr:hypothetical protein B9Z19DRAFT_1191631 [Tuber borchii]
MSKSLVRARGGLRMNALHHPASQVLSRRSLAGSGPRAAQNLPWERIALMDNRVYSLGKEVFNIGKEMRDLATKVDLGFVRLENQINTVQSTFASQISNLHGFMDSKISTGQSSLDTEVSNFKTSVGKQIWTVQRILGVTFFVVIVVVLICGYIIHEVLQFYKIRIMGALNAAAHAWSGQKNKY